MNFKNRILCLIVSNLLLCSVLSTQAIASDRDKKTTGKPYRPGYFQISQFIYQHQDAEIKSIPVSTGSSPPTTTLADRELEFDAGLGFSLIYGFGTSTFLNSEVEFAYRRADLRQLLTPTGKFLASGDVQMASFMFNLPFRYQTGTPVTPYLGAGIGLNWQKGDIRDIGDGSLAPSTGEETAIAYQILAGLTYRVSPRVELLLGYKFLGTPDTDFGTIGLENRTHNFQFGIRMYMKEDSVKNSRAMKKRKRLKGMRKK